MKTLSCTALVLFLFSLIQNPTAEAQGKVRAKSLGEICSSAVEIGSNGLFKWRASDHINPADPRAKGPSLICNSNNRKCVQWPAKMFNCDGSEVQKGTLYRYGIWNVNGADRGYTFRASSSAMRRKARQKSCDAIYIQIQKQLPSSIPACYSVLVSEERNGSTF